MTTIRLVRVMVVLMVASFGLTAAADAQSNDDVFQNLQWNFSTPGARANGMGRSFIGIADDATAAVTNPAGLLSLTRPQVYAEYKNARVRTDRLAAVDALTTLAPTTNTSVVNALSFLSVSAPVNSKMAVGFSVHRFLDYHERFSLAPRAIPNYPGGGGVFYPFAGYADFTGTALGGSLAYNVTNNLRLGVTVAANRLNADSDVTRNRTIYGPAFFQGNPNDLAMSPELVSQSSIHDAQTALSGAVGAFYHVNDMVNLGFSYGKSPRFETSEDLRYAGSNNQLVSVPGYPKPVSINVPDHFGLGVGIRPTSRLLVAADAVRTNYSSLSKDTTLIFSSTQLTGSEYVTPDVTEVHVGAEYNFYNMQGNPMFVRGGIFTNPAHLVTFAGTADPRVNAAESASYNLLPRRNETRGTAGVGIALGPRAQIDAAYVFGKEFVLSSGVRF
jgi:long-chain fatty acid transport protein